MRQYFLERVAQNLLDRFGHNLSRIVAVFPNKRASLFMNEHLANLSDRPVWTPTYITISDLIHRQASLQPCDQIMAVSELHKSFTKATRLDETLDHFYGWGQLLLADFDDIDKNMADAGQVFANLKNIHELDDISYLTEEQKTAIKAFFSNFDDNHETELKRRFLSLWSHFADIYTDFRQRLAQKGLAYEGALYREVAEKGIDSASADCFVFVGFNVLLKAEQTMFSKLRQEGKALFYWDFDHYYMPGKTVVHEAGRYISQYLADFPNALDTNDTSLYDNLKHLKDVTFMSATTENIQARYVSTWLREKQRMADGKKTAIVMCDEALLPTIIHSLPAEVDKVNITTGFPLTQTPMASFVPLLMELQVNGLRRDRNSYRLSCVNKVLRHPCSAFMSDQCQTIMQQLTDPPHYYPTRSQLTADGGLALLFADLGCGENRREPSNLALLEWLLKITKWAGINAKDTADVLTKESIFSTYTLLNRLHTLVESGELEVNISTLQRLIDQLIRSASIPFHGEPAEGIQIMGVLETRNLDFDHLLVLSCNEGNMPKGVNDASFIPYSLRKAYGLTTIDNKVAIYAYYFYRLMQRTGDATLAYNQSTEDGHTGEMSRFMLQWMVESGGTVKKTSLTATKNSTSAAAAPVEKDPDTMERLDQLRTLSPTAINTYLRCPLQFFYKYVAAINEPEEDEEATMDNRTFGNIFHISAQRIYGEMAGKGTDIKAADIDRFLKTPAAIERIVDEVFEEELFKMGSRKQKPEYNGIQIINRQVIISYLKQLLTADRQLTPFAILGLELKVATSLTLSTSRGQHTVRIGGIIDRLDRITDKTTGKHRIRVIDYKTGKPATLKIQAVGDIFDGQGIGQRHSDYYLQAMLYSLIVSNSGELNPDGLDVSPALLFIQQAAKDNYDPTLCIGQGIISDIGIYRKEFMECLTGLVTEIQEPQQPFRPTNDKARCTLCPYQLVCQSAATRQ